MTGIPLARDATMLDFYAAHALAGLVTHTSYRGPDREAPEPAANTPNWARDAFREPGDVVDLAFELAAEALAQRQRRHDLYPADAAVIQERYTRMMASLPEADAAA